MSTLSILEARVKILEDQLEIKNQEIKELIFVVQTVLLGVKMQFGVVTEEQIHAKMDELESQAKEFEVQE